MITTLFRFHISLLAFGVLLLSAPHSAFAGPSKPDFSAFTNILANNVFNTKRSPRFVPTPAPAQRVIATEYLSLTGTMRDERGPLAFFYGSRPDYQKVLKPDDTVAGLKITEIEHAYVKLKNGTNELMLPVNMQLSREEEGEWRLGARSDTFSSSAQVASSSEGGSDSGRSGDSSDGRQRGDRSRGDRGDRRSRDRRGNSSNSSGSEVVPEPIPFEASAGLSNSPPGSISNGPEADILEILRRRREQENSQ
jgi:hypothetical protein